MSVAKAGIIATLNARTSVLASANPVGSRYNPRLSIIDNINLPPSLVSRFDLIYLVLDKADEATDRKLARHLLSLHYERPTPSSQARWRPMCACNAASSGCGLTAAQLFGPLLHTSHLRGSFLGNGMRFVPTCIIYVL